MALPVTLLREPELVVWLVPLVRRELLVLACDHLVSSLSLRWSSPSTWRYTLICACTDGISEAAVVSKRSRRERILRTSSLCSVR